jgi:hypothetical protein
MLTPSELADHDLWATRRVEREAYLEAHQEDRRTDMISDESQKPTASHASLPVGVVDQMAAERAVHQKGERDAIDSVELARAAAPQMLAALREAEAALSMTAKEPPGDFVSTDMLALRTVRAAIAAAEGRAA